MSTNPTRASKRGTQRRPRRNVNERLREFCRLNAIDPEHVRTRYPHVAALIDELGAS
jgi:hypothetical protein